MEVSVVEVPDEEVLVVVIGVEVSVVVERLFVLCERVVTVPDPVVVVFVGPWVRLLCSDVCPELLLEKLL